MGAVAVGFKLVVEEGDGKRVGGAHAQVEKRAVAELDEVVLVRVHSWCIREGGGDRGLNGIDAGHRRAL